MRFSEWSRWALGGSCRAGGPGSSVGLEAVLANERGSTGDCLDWERSDHRGTWPRSAANWQLIGHRWVWPTSHQSCSCPSVSSFAPPEAPSSTWFLRLFSLNFCRWGCLPARFWAWCEDLEFFSWCYFEERKVFRGQRWNYPGCQYRGQGFAWAIC